MTDAEHDRVNVLRSVSHMLDQHHLCRVRHCVNPAHMEPVTIRQNVLRGEGNAAQNARKTHCVHGHPLEGDNLKVTPKGWRVCLTCRRERKRQRRAKLQVAAQHG